MREAKIQCEGVGKTFIQKGNTQVHVLRDVSIDVGRNEFVVILGPGQCGKTTLLRMIAGFEKPSVGRVLMDGREIEGPGHDKGFVFQSYMLFAWRTVRGNVEVGPRVRNLPREERRRLSQQYIDMVGLNGFEEHYPHQLSGGMSQRVMIAMAIACRPKLLIADEPTTALDVTIQAQIIELLLELQQKENMALVLITHDLALVAEAAHKIIVMYAGQVVETGDAHAIFHAPRHPYTQALLRALPEFAQDKERLASLPGVVPGKYDRPNGCLLNPRCPYATDRCRAEEPALNMLADGRQSKCHYPLDDAGRPTL